MNQLPSSKDRRNYRRIPEEVTVKANKITYPADESEFSAGKSRDLSEGGILIQLSTEFDPGAILQVKVTLPGWSKSDPGSAMVREDSIDSPFTAVCEVVRTKKVGDIFETALRFVNIAEDDYHALRRYLKEQAEPKKEGN